MSWRDLLGYWQGKHAAGKLPGRDTIDPATEIPKLVGNLMLIEVEGELFKLRLIGSELVRRAGRDLTGSFVDPTIIMDPGVGTWLGLLKKASLTRAPVLYYSTPGLQSIHGAIGLIAPLENAESTVDFLLCGLFFGDTPIVDRPVGLYPGELIELAIPSDPAAGVELGRTAS